MNRRGFLGALMTAVAAPAVLPHVSADADAPPVAPPMRERHREPASLRWCLPRDWSLDDIEGCLEKLDTWPRLRAVAIEFGSAADRDRFLRLFNEDPRATLAPRTALVPIYVSERLGARGLRIEMEMRS